MLRCVTNCRKIGRYRLRQQGAVRPLTSANFRYCTATRLTHSIGDVSNITFRTGNESDPLRRNADLPKKADCSIVAEDRPAVLWSEDTGFYSPSYVPDTSTSTLRTHPPLEESGEPKPVAQDAVHITTKAASKRQQKRLRRLLRYSIRLVRAEIRRRTLSERQIAQLIKAFQRMSSSLASDGISAPISNPDILAYGCRVIEDVHALLPHACGHCDTGKCARELLQYTIDLQQALSLDAVWQPKMYCQEDQNASCSKLSTKAHISEQSAIRNGPSSPKEHLVAIYPSSQRPPGRKLEHLEVAFMEKAALPALCGILETLPLPSWTEIPRNLLERLTLAVCASSEASAAIFAAMLVARDYGSANSSKPAGSKNSVNLGHFSTIMPHAQPRLWGPSPEQTADFCVMTFLLQTQLTKLRASSPFTSAHDSTNLDQIRTLVQVFRQRHLQRHLLPDRTVILSFLQCILLTRKDPDNGITVEWLWKNWTMLKECMPPEDIDGDILAAFLEFGSLARGNVCDVKTTTAPPPAPFWLQQALDRAASILNLRKLSTPRNQAYLDASADVSQGQSSLLRATANAALRTSQFDIGFACLFDERFAATDTPSVLGSLAQAIGEASATRTTLAYALAETCARDLLHLASRIDRKLAIDEAESIMNLVEVLAKMSFRFAAASFFLAIGDCRAIDGHRVALFLRMLKQNGDTRLLRKIYGSQAFKTWTQESLCTFLSSNSSHLSDRVWTKMIRSGEGMSIAALKARLRHHKIRRPFSYNQAMTDFQIALEIVEGIPDITTQLRLLDLHILAREGGAANQIYDQIQHNHPGASSRLRRRSLQMASLPKYRRYRDRGIKTRLRQITHRVDAIVTQGKGADVHTAMQLTLSSLKWAELDDEAIWTILKNAPAPGQNGWHEVKPLYAAAVRAFRRRGNPEAAREAVLVMREAKRKAADCA